MDVPELNQDLIDKIVEQSDSQSGKHSIRDLERIRDENLVAIMQGLKLQDWGAGAVLKAYEEQLYTKAHSSYYRHGRGIPRAGFFLLHSGNAH